MALLYNQTNLSRQDLLNSIALSDTLSSDQKLNYRKHSKANFRIRIHSTLSRLKKVFAQNLIMQIEMFPTRPQIKFMAISVYFAERIRRDNFWQVDKKHFSCVYLKVLNYGSIKNLNSEAFNDGDCDERVSSFI